MSQAFQCDGCGGLKADRPHARAEITLGGTSETSAFEFCEACAGRITRVPEAAKRIVSPPPVDVGALLAQLADASEAVGYGRHAHPGNIVAVLLERALAVKP